MYQIKYGFPMILTLLAIQAILGIEMGGKYYKLFSNSRSEATYSKIIRVASKYECALVCHEEEACILANMGFLEEQKFDCEIMSIGSVISNMSIGDVEQWDIIGRFS